MVVISVASGLSGHSTTAIFSRCSRKLSLPQQCPIQRFLNAPDPAYPQQCRVLPWSPAPAASDWGTLFYLGANCRTKKYLFIPMNIGNYTAFTTVQRLGWCIGLAWADRRVSDCLKNHPKEDSETKDLRERDAKIGVCQGRERGQ